MIRKTLKFIFLIILANLIINQGIAQESSDSLQLFYGRLITEDNKPVALAHVINVNMKIGVASDTLGYFKIWVYPGNTLNLSAIGFEFLEYTLSGRIPDTLTSIILHRRFYEIPEVSITYFGTYKDFEYKVLNLKLKDENVINELVLKQLPRVEDPQPYEPNLGNPISLLYNMLSREGKSQRKYMEIKEQEPLLRKAEAKYNREIVKNITGLDGMELNEFMDTLNFSDTYIINTSEYVLYGEILKRFEGFKKRRDLSEDTE